MGYYILKKGEDDQYYFNLHADNHQVILRSEGYTRKEAAENGIESTRTNAAFSSRFHLKRAQNDEIYFVLKAANGQIIGVSEMYKTTQAAEKGIESVIRNAPNANVVDDTGD